MNETATHPKDAQHLLEKKWKIWLSLLFAGVLLLSAAAIPIVQNYRTIQRIEALGGYIMTEPGPLLSCFPKKVQRFLIMQRGAPLSHIAIVGLTVPSIDDTDLASLKSFVNPITLLLDNTSISDAGLVHLKEVTNLKRLRISNTAVTDAGLIHLKGITNLNELNLDITKITDAGLIELSGMPNLTLLTLQKTEVTDAGLAHLKGMKKLKWLFLDDTKVTAEGIKQLEAALPGCNINWSPRPKASPSP